MARSPPLHHPLGAGGRRALERGEQTLPPKGPSKHPHYGDGHVGNNGGEFLEIVPLERIVWLWYFADADGNRVSPAHYGMPDEDREGNIDVILFEDHGSGQTKLTYTRNDPTASKEEQEGAAAGYGEIFDKLVEVVAELVHGA